ncbi:MAG TPA: zinc ribbon domain-containing protein [Gemmatimonadales bacterium]|nr:zinc ribbon domain-containing protein [Gemmatimonadales bacterium]
MNELERFFRRLVGNLASTDPARLHRPIPLDDVRHSIIPYRTNRRALGFDSSEDYEMVLLRLCAGEGGFIRAEPEEARARFAAELDSPNPDLDVLERVGSVVLMLRSEPLARALGPEPEGSDAPSPPPSPRSRPAPPEPLDVPEFPEDVPGFADVGEPVEAEPGEDEPVPPHCLYCGGALPAHRAVNFCPHCGQSQTVPVCPQCHVELEPGWRHCVNCGAAVSQA